MRKNLLYVFAGIAIVSAWQLGFSQQTAPDTKKAGSRGGKKAGYDGPMNKVLLKDYDPNSNLVVAEHHPAKAKFPVIDVHVHPAAQTPQEVAQWVKTMDEVGVETAVLMTGAVGKQFDDLVDLYLKPYPNRFVLYCGMDTRNLSIEAPDFPQKSRPSWSAAIGRAPAASERLPIRVAASASQAPSTARPPPVTSASSSTIHASTSSGGSAPI